MKKSLLAISLLLFLFSCKKNQNVEPQADKYPGWTRLEIKNGREAHAVYGSIDDTLVVSTLTEIQYTTDKGKTWKHANGIDEASYGFLLERDSLFSLRATATNSEGAQFATMNYQFSLDNGVNWQYYRSRNVFKSKPLGTAISADSVQFRVKRNIQPYDPKYPLNGILLKSDVEFFDGFSFEKIEVPFDNQINNIHIDKSQRLYISASRSLHDKETGAYRDYERDEPAILYISNQTVDELIKR